MSTKDRGGDAPPPFDLSCLGSLASCLLLLPPPRSAWILQHLQRVLAVCPLNAADVRNSFRCSPLAVVVIHEAYVIPPIVRPPSGIRVLCRRRPSFCDERADGEEKRRRETTRQAAGRSCTDHRPTNSSQKPSELDYPSLIEDSTLIDSLSCEKPSV